ncbi:MAG: hypothetical protein WB681_08410 [Candidatus Cybelea sp.]
MKNLARSALSICTAAALLAGCGGSEPPIRTAGLMPLRRAAAVRKEYNVTKPLLYVTNYTYNTVTVYHARAKNPAPVAVISLGIDTPGGDCVDGKGVLYVDNQPPSGGGWISEYSPGETQPFQTVTAGINTPAFCAIDAKGNLWVTNIGGRNVTEYLYGSTNPHNVITRGLIYPVGVAIDHAGNLYVSNRIAPYSGNIVIYAPGRKSPSRTITDGVTSPVGIAIDSSGTLYVTDDYDSRVEEYRPGKRHPFQEITRGLESPDALVVNKNGWLYAANFGSSEDILEFPPDSLVPSRRKISKGVFAPNGVAYFPSLQL